MRRKYAWWPVLVLMLMLSGCGTESAGEDIPAYLVIVAGEGTCGSGIIYSMDGESLNVLTAAHVVENIQSGKSETHGSSDPGFVENEEADRVMVCFCDGWEIACTDILVSGTADVAMIRIPVSEISEKRQRQYQCVKTDKESFDGLEAGDGCTAVGFGAGTDGRLGGVVRYEGSILKPWIYMEDYGQYMIWAQAGIRSGMSGGGLFDDGGCFIGLLSGGNEQGELAAVPLSLILQFDMDISENF